MRDHFGELAFMGWYLMMPPAFSMKNEYARLNLGAPCQSGPSYAASTAHLIASIFSIEPWLDFIHWRGL
jgi:hypothetical protein